MQEEFEENRAKKDRIKKALSLDLSKTRKKYEPRKPIDAIKGIVN